MRTRLTPEERERKRKERASFSFSDAAYKHYNVERDGYGDPSDWERIAEQLFGAAQAEEPPQAEARPRATGRLGRYLDALGLLALPSLADLTKAFRNAMFKAHPDYGGTDAQARTVLEAYAILKREVR